ncbi:MAG: hypothetical protein MUE69_06780 [Myxococcota bacterium]|nr:hypothetical protein [Myxococcota bacterium]
MATFPVVLGRGKRLFPNEGASNGWTLTSSSVSDTGVWMARYRKDGEVPRADAPPPE